MSQSVILYRNRNDELKAALVDGPGGLIRRDDDIVGEFLDDEWYEGCELVGYILFDDYSSFDEKPNSDKHVYQPEIVEKVTVERKVGWPIAGKRPVAF